GVSDRLTNAAGSVTSKVETDPLGTQVDDTANYNFSGNTNYNSSPNGFYGDPQQPQMCSLAGFPTPCSIAVHLVNVGMYDQSDLVFGNPWSIQNLQLTRGKKRLYPFYKLTHLLALDGGESNVSLSEQNTQQ